jgi:hypothetical protein
MQNAVRRTSLFASRVPIELGTLPSSVRKIFSTANAPPPALAAILPGISIRSPSNQSPGELPDVATAIRAAVTWSTSPGEMKPRFRETPASSATAIHGGRSPPFRRPGPRPPELHQVNEGRPTALNRASRPSSSCRQLHQVNFAGIDVPNIRTSRSRPSSSQRVHVADIEEH